MKKLKMISISEAAARGVERLRKPTWASLLDHIEIDIINGQPGLWAHLWAPFNKECNGRDPVDVLILLWGRPDHRDFVVYDGPLPDSDEYRAAVKTFEGVLDDLL
jgi:hypothetical protein